MIKFIHLKKALAYTSRTVFLTLLIGIISLICIQHSAAADSPLSQPAPLTLQAKTRKDTSDSAQKTKRKKKHEPQIGDPGEERENTETRPESTGRKPRDTKMINLVIDPGHGGDQSGAENNEVTEKHLNLKIAEYLKEELESSYDNINISFTRDGDYNVDLKERVQIAADRNADMLISLHNNARGEKYAYKDGCTVLTAQGNYKPELAQKEQELACCLLSELTALGLNDRGILLRDSEIGDTYENGSVADYYAIIRSGINLDVPSIIIEHAFMDEESDYENHLSSDEKLRELALADARGIAKYFRLPSKEDGDVLPLPENYEITFYHMYDDNPDHNKISTEIFYPSDDKPAASEEDNTKEESTKRSEDSTKEASTKRSEDNTDGNSQDSDHSVSGKKSKDSSEPDEKSSDKKSKDSSEQDDKSSDKKSTDSSKQDDKSSDEKSKDSSKPDDKSSDSKDTGSKTFIDYILELIRLMRGGK